MSILLQIFLFLSSILILEIIILLILGFIKRRSLSLWSSKPERTKDDVCPKYSQKPTERIEKSRVGFCPRHGPYDTSLGKCPYSHDPSDLPVPPTPLDEGEGETEIPARRRTGRGILNAEEEETGLGRGMRDDVTELDIVSHGGPLGMLWVKEGPRRGKFYPIRNGTVIGRKEGNLILDDPKVSGSHAKFTMEQDKILIWDFGSANGTYINGKKIREATALEENDLVKIGRTVFVIKLLGQDAGDTDSVNDVMIPEIPMETNHFNVSVSCPLCLAKKFASVFLFHFYLPLPENRARVKVDIGSEYQGQRFGIPIDRASKIKLGQKMKVKLSNPNFSFSDSDVKVVDEPVNKITFLVMPSENCEPGPHKILASISDAETGDELESITINVQVVDFAFDHISRPLLSKVSTLVLSIGSFIMFMLTFLEQVDKTVGITSGTTAGVLAAVVYANFYNLYQRIRLNTP